MGRYRLYYVIVAAILLFVGGGIAYLVFIAGVRISIRNMGQEMMRDATVLVTGRRYSIGDLAPGHPRSVRVSPTSESNVEVEFTDEQDRRVRLDAGCYLEPGYRGQIDIEIRDGEAVAVKDAIRSGY